MSEIVETMPPYAETGRWGPEDVGAAAAALRRGELVAFPTETVYGLGGDGGSDRAVAAIYAAKGRPRFNPLILHVEGIEAARRIADLPPGAL
ncbi:MAG: L-threonylcarbamoyladenylate synthase, partial [Pikeienuella sp.]